MPVYILKYFEKLTGKPLTKNSNLRYIAGERALKKRKTWNKEIT